MYAPPLEDVSAAPLLLQLQRCILLLPLRSKNGLTHAWKGEPRQWRGQT